MNTRGVAIGLVAVLVFSAVGGFFVGTAAAVSSVEVDLDSNEVGARTTHNVSLAVDSNEASNSLSEIVIDYSNNSSTGASFDLTGVSNDSIEALGYGGSRGNVSTSAHYDVNSVSTEENGTKLVITLGGNEVPKGGDWVTVRFADVVNTPQRGTYGVRGDLNTESSVSPATTQIRIEDTTPPAVNLNLTADGQGLDAVVDSNERLSELNVTIDDGSGTAVHALSIDRFNESGGGTDWTYTASGLSVQDGPYTATVDEAVDEYGNAANPNEQDDATVNRQSITVTSGNVSPATAGGGTTVSQTVNVSVVDASAYGANEEVSIAVDDSVTVENASASLVGAGGSASTAGSATVDNGTVSVAVNSGSGGGTVDYVVRFDINTTYVGEHARTEPIDATAIDNGGEEQDGPTRVATVDVTDVTPPRITNFTLLADGQNVDLELNATEQLDTAAIDLTGDAAADSLSLSAVESSEEVGDTWRYVFAVSDGMDGDFAANVSGAGSSYYVADAAGNENPGSYDDAISVNAEPIEVVDANVTNAVVDRGATATHTVSVDVDQVSKDGNDDTVRVVFPSAVGAGNVSLDGGYGNVSATTAADGGAAFNVTVNPGDGGGVADVNVSFDVTASYPDSLPEGAVYPVNASAFDSDGDTDGPDNHTQLRVRSVPPTITNFTLFTADGPQDVDLTFDASERLSTAAVSFENDLADRGNLTLDGNVSLRNTTDGSYTYGADVVEGADGEFDASLGAADRYNIAAEGEDLDAELVVNETDPVVVDATIDPDSVRPGETATANVSVSVDGFSRDGNADGIRVTFPAGVDVAATSALGVTDRNGNGASGSGLSDPDNRTVVVDVASGGGLGTANVTAAFDAEIGYGAELEGETVPLNVTAIDSDGARNATTNETRVRVADTRPRISNFTLNDTDDGVDLSFDSTEALADVTVSVTGDLASDRSLGVDDFAVSRDGGNWTYTNESLLTRDGTYDASLDAGAATDADGNANPENHSAGVVRDAYAIDVVDANVTAGAVDPNSTVTQQVTVDVNNVSRDGETDTVELDFGAGGVTAENVTSSVGSASVADADNLTADVATGGGGGVAGLTLTYTVTADYPLALEGETLAVNASATDSDGASDTETNATSVRVRTTVPEITNFTLVQRPAGSQDVDLTFDASERLGSATVSFNGDLAGESRSLAGNLTLVEVTDGTYVYESDASENADGSFNASLTAADPNGNAAEGDLDAGLVVNETDPVVVDATIEPNRTDPGATVASNLTASVDGFSRDGETDEITVTLPDGVTIEGTSGFGITGADGSIVGTDNGTVTIGVSSGDGLGTADVTASFDATLTYDGAAEGETLPVNATASDSDGASDTETNATNVRVANTRPRISNFTLVNTTDGVDLSFNASEPLATVSVELSGDLDTSRTLGRGNFTERGGPGEYSYTAETVVTRDGVYNATLTAGAAADADGNTNPDGYEDGASRNVNGIVVVDANVTDEPVGPNSTVTQQVTVDVANVSRDGETDTVGVTVEDPAGVSAVNVSSDTGTASLADAGNLTAAVATGSGGGVTDLTLTYTVTADYPLSAEGTTLAVNASATDSDGDSDSVSNATSVRVRTTNPEITNFTLFTADGPQDVDLTFDASERLGSATVSFNGDLAGETRTLAGNLTLVEATNGSYTYGVDASEGADGSFNATLTAADPNGNAAGGDLDAELVVNETDPVVVDATIEPSEVEPGATVTATLTASVDGFSRDGGTDRIRVVFGDGVDAGSVEWIGVDGANGGTATLLDNRTISLDVASGDGLGTADVTADFDATLTYDGAVEGETVPLNVTAIDSDGASDAATNATNVSVVNTRPRLSSLTLNDTADGVDLTFDASEALATVSVDLSGEFEGTRTLDRGAFDERGGSGEYTYTAENLVVRDGVYNATLAAGAAADADGNTNPDAHTDGVVRNENGIVVVDANVTNGTVDPESTVTQQVTVDVANVSRDGEADTVTAAFNDSVGVAATDVSSDTGTATLTDADNLTAAVATGSGGGVADLTLTYTVTATYGDALEGESLAVGAAATDSDGDADGESALANVSVRDTRPLISNLTLVADGRDVTVTFDATEAVESLTVERTGDSGGDALTRGEFIETADGDGFAYEANVSSGIDGTFNVSLAAGAAVDNAGNGNPGAHTAGLTVDTRDVTVVDATITPERVDPESSVETRLTASAEAFGVDGGTDTLTLALNESLNVTGVGGATVTAGDATATGAEAVDADGDGTAESVRISLATGDGGGTVDVTAAANATVAYPATVEGATLAVDAAATDSDGSSDAATNATAVRVRDVAPTITNFSLTAAGQDVTVSFVASEPLSATAVELGGDANGTLTGLGERRASEDEWVYTGTVSAGVDGYFVATLSEAVDRFGNDAADGRSDALRVNEIRPAIQRTRISPGAVLPGERTNATLTTNVTGLSRDGVNDTVTYAFTNESAVELGNVSAVGANASAVVENTSVVVNVSSANASGSANVTFSTNVTTTYDNSTEGGLYNVTTVVDDSLNGTAVTNTTVAVNDTVPAITAFDLTAEGQDVNLTVTSNETLATLNASLGGDLNDSLTRGNFTETAWGTYVANVTAGADGNVTATLTNATDPYGNNATVGWNDSVVVDTVNVTVESVNATPAAVGPNATVDGGTVLNVSGLNRDGGNDTATVTVGNGTDVLAANASVADANVTAAVTAVNDSDADGLNETVVVELNTTDSLGTANGSLLLNTTTSYGGSLEGTNVTVTGTVNDSDGSTDAANGTVAVVDTVPTVRGFDVSLNGSTVELSMRADEPLTTVDVALSGGTGGNLTRADFTTSREDGWTTYTTELAERRGGRFAAELVTAADAAGNAAPANGTDELIIRVGGGGGGQQQGGDEAEAGENVTRISDGPAGPPLSVRVESTDEGREVIVENARPGAEVAAHLTPTGAEANASVRLSDVGFATTDEGTATLSVRGTSTAEFAPLPEGVEPVVAYAVEGTSVGGTEYTVRVEDDRLGERSPDALRLFDGAGEELNVTYTGEVADRHAFEVDAEVERFAVTLTGANVSVAGADLPPANASGVTPEAVPVTVTLANTGPLAGNRTVTVTAAGEPLAERTLRVAADATRTVNVSVDLSDLDREGPTTVAANGVEAGTIPPAEERPTPEPDPTTTEGDSPFAIATLLVALAGAALLARRS